ncbi:urea ABC transporter permease subunit UrtB [Pseudomaricurvus sp. HS19]|uniref:urea ABC transporter permease subunit UrtB n=1 Tax=Pseudomaricurvus sp. HS19 TaxID=2692626 RepID=UPI00351A59AB
MNVLPISRLCLALVLLLASSLSLGQEQAEAPAAAETEVAVQAPAESSAERVQTILQQLAEANYREKARLITTLDQLSGKEMLPLYSAMLEGELHYLPGDLSLYRVTEAGEVTSLFTQQAAASVMADELEKIRVNNSLRKQLRESIARIQLLYGDKGEREIAAATLLDNMSDESIALLQKARASEQDVDVLGLLDAGIAMYTATTSDSTAERVSAVRSLSGRLESPVRNLLTQLADKEREDDDAVRQAAASALKDIEGKIKFFELTETVFFGMSLGSVLLLAAIGLAITFGVMGVINMAHGEMIMLGAYTTYVVQLLLPQWLELSVLIAIPAAFLVSGAVGVIIERTVIRHLHGRALETLLATFGISLILQQLVRTVFSPLNRQVATPEWLSGSWVINPVFSLTYNRLAILIFALVVFVALLLIMKRTSLGLYVRAVSQNRDMAKAMGIKTERVDMMTFGLGSGIAGVAGVALSQLTNVGPNLGQSYIIDSFMVVVFGGVGNLFGTLVGAFSLGIANKFLEPATGAVLANILILVFIILFIQKRPKGLFPQKGRAAE